jgi:hypothetical protein
MGRRNFCRLQRKTCRVARKEIRDRCCRDQDRKFLETPEFAALGRGRNAPSVPGCESGVMIGDSENNGKLLEERTWKVKLNHPS